MFDAPLNLSVNTVAEIVRLAVAPVFLLSGIASFVNVCTARLSRIVDRSRQVEPMLLASRGAEHDRWLGELHVLDRRMSLVSWAISLSVLAAALICAVVVLLFSASLTSLHVATAIALLFIGSMISIDRDRLRDLPGRDPRWLARGSRALRAASAQGRGSRL